VYEVGVRVILEATCETDRELMPLSWNILVALTASAAKITSSRVHTVIRLPDFFPITFTPRAFYWFLAAVALPEIICDRGR
jgi:hypothetical protein